MLLGRFDKSIGDPIRANDSEFHDQFPLLFMYLVQA